MDKLFVIDGNSLINRAYYALPLLSSHDGVYSNAVFGFVNCLIKLIQENMPKYIIVAFDYSRKTFRNNIYSDYKGTRKPAPHEMIAQFGLIQECLDLMGIKWIKQEGIEADDIIGTIVKNSSTQNFIITGDRDSLQLIDNHTNVWLTIKGITEIKEVNLNNMGELYGLTPSQIIDYKALAGDSSDNIPGVAGIGDKRAKDLISAYGSIKNIYEHIDDFKGKLKENLITQKDACYMSYELATIKTDCTLDLNLKDCTYDFPFSQKVKKFFLKYDFSSLVKKDALFSYQEAKEQKEVQYTKVVITQEELSGLNLNDVKAVSLYEDDKYFQLFFNNTLYQIDKLPLILSGLDKSGAILASFLNKLFNSGDIVKVLCGVKSFMHEYGISDFVNVFDLSLASYLTSGGQKPMIFDGVETYFGEYEMLSQKLKDLSLEDLYSNIELPLTKVLYSMECDGFMIDVQQLDALLESTKAELDVCNNQILSFTENKALNINSPKQVSEFLFDELKISDWGNKKHSTSAESLQKIEFLHPVISHILKYRKIAKLYNTYILPYKELSKFDPMIHTIFNQTQTATGRLSSSDPNLQNIPVRDEEGKKLRKLFISRFDGGSIISADYNQIELRLLANFSKDQNLLNDYSSGVDIHSLTAAQIFGVQTSSVTPDMRRMAKAVNFGIIYGISGFGLSKNIDLSVKQAQKYIDLYFEKYPGVKKYLDSLIQTAKQTGKVETLFKRFRAIPELNSSSATTRQLGERLAMNTPLQGSASDLIKLAMLNVYKKIEQKGLKSKLILQIHDELIVDTFPGEEEEVKSLLSSEMTGVYNFEIPLEVSIGQGKTLYDCK